MLNYVFRDNDNKGKNQRTTFMMFNNFRLPDPIIVTC